PFGMVLTRAAGLRHNSDIGSGNIGATNVLRTGRKDLALATLLLDSGKAAIAAFVARWLSGDPGLIAMAGSLAFFGHCFPVFLKFKGGKGVATYFGTLLAFWWVAFLAAAASWLLVAFVMRISSLAALVTAIVVPLVFLFAGQPTFMIGSGFMSLLIFYRHRANITRLIDGSEPRIGAK
ncbi:MAG: glycerol-3-phosphate 1-O-acyltransferase PlsY, partial [Parvularculaceae bacterium]|nr:glycerol-3-phosphate 1-O-acyltransferase PlsY [Parvularculaceae bacterium]